MNQEQKELELIRKITNGNQKAFEGLFNTYFRYLHNIAYNRLRSKEVAEDIVQDIFTDLWKNRESLEIHTSVKSYLFQATKNRVYKHIRHQSVREKEIYIRRIHDDYYSQNTFPQTQKVMEGEELEYLVTEHLGDLPEKSQTIFAMSRDDHFTYREIAEKMNCSPKTVEYHIGKVLQHLRVNLKDYVTFLFFFSFLLLI
ncbi:MAG: RNA polymerase sigma-70 factor [Bacteroidetes bacterium]|jgi:RNA polymerase sigma-70 factor (ECF subfamily)|nr:RNA polymerase sigma-70 factor [Bacteroidota bacterium]